MNNDYQPIDCGAYDEIEVFAMRKTTVELQYVVCDGDGSEVLKSTTTVIKDVFSKGSEEFIELDSGVQIRLDRLVKLNRRPIDGSCRLTNR